MQETFEFHWGKHHRAYVTNMNNQIQGSDLEKLSLEEVGGRFFPALTQRAHIPCQMHV